MDKYYYISINFHNQTKSAIKNELDKVFTPDMLYKSEVISYIDGIVVSNLHLTLFYGLTEPNDQLRQYIKALKIDTIKLGKIKLKRGYKGLYKFAYVEVLDEDGVLKSLHDSFIQFRYEKEVQQSDFFPHLTLAYLQTETPTNLIEEVIIPKTLVVESITLEI